jgi:hypothetical protein
MPWALSQLTCSRCVFLNIFSRKFEGIANPQSGKYAFAHDRLLFLATA